MTKASQPDPTPDTRPPTAMPLIAINNLTHRFPDGTTGLDGVSLDIDAGAFVVIAGANGSGKTTLLRHLNGLLRPTSGSVSVAGLSVPDHLLRVRSQVGLVFQDADSQIVGETVYADVAFGPENLKLSRSEVERRVEDALSLAGLRHLAGKRPHLLSGGEKRRLAIAGVLAMEPRVVVCDEPFASLDFPGVRQVLALLVQLHRRGGTVVVTTHDLDKVLAHAERLIVLAAGRIVMDGPPHSVALGLERFDVRTPRAGEAGVETLSWLN
jgi:biotin transport system ATP-binding protein